ncbi:peptidoglycan glycosyltransferase [Opitutaceae bacterium TAV3]|nr:peptidoglycan glycosyltransferase [Opitutaceae bacterium TAV3]
MATPTEKRPGSGGLVESFRSFNPRILFFNYVIAAMILILVGGLAYRQLIRAGEYSEQAKVQNQRRILVPGPRGNIYDREGRLLVGNRPRFAVTLYLDELRTEFRAEYLRIGKNYRDADAEDEEGRGGGGDKARERDRGRGRKQNMPTSSELALIARYSVVQRYLDKVNALIGRADRVDARDLHRHYDHQRILPYILVEDLTREEAARIIENVPVSSPLQLYTSSVRHYPYGRAAAHVLGYVLANDDLNVDRDFPGSDLTTFAMKGTIGRDGLERQFDDRLQGQTGGTIHLVDPAGYRVEPALERRQPVQGGDLITSLDIDLQIAAEKAMRETGFKGATVALDPVTGEVLVLASMPGYDLNEFVPRLTHAESARINEQGAWMNRAIQGLYAPGSTFKLITALAGIRSGHITAGSEVECTGYYQVGKVTFVCNNHRDRGPVTFPQAIEKSCNTFFYTYGIQTGPDAIAAEARRFGLDQRTGIELPGEIRNMIVPDPAWKKREIGLSWFPGDTANMSIGQGYLAVTPLGMATFVASLARGETQTHPTLLHDPQRPRQRSAPLDLPFAEHAALLAGMEAVPLTGTGRILNTPLFKIPDLRIAGKTGTAQKRTSQGTLNFAWFVGFAPIESPRIAIAVMLEGDTPGEDTGGGRYAAPVAGAILKAWHAKRGQIAANAE